MRRCQGRLCTTHFPASVQSIGGLELWRPRLQTGHLLTLTAYFGHPLRQAYVRLGRRAGGGGGQGSLRFLRFSSHRPWFGGVFFCDGRVTDRYLSRQSRKNLPTKYFFVGNNYYLKQAHWGCPRSQELRQVYDDIMYKFLLVTNFGGR